MQENFIWLNNMKIAYAMDNGFTFSQHFGRAAKYLVIMVKRDKSLNHEMWEKLGHRRFAQEEITLTANTW